MKSIQKKIHHSKPCQHIEIAQSKLGDVHICSDCGVVHLSLQSISMRFDVEAFKVISTMLSVAQHIIEHAENNSEISKDQVRHTHFDQHESSKVH